jgi:hypothetical protein
METRYPYLHNALRAYYQKQEDQRLDGLPVEIDALMKNLNIEYIEPSGRLKKLGNVYDLGLMMEALVDPTEYNLDQLCAACSCINIEVLKSRAGHIMASSLDVLRTRSTTCYLCAVVARVIKYGFYTPQARHEGIPISLRLVDDTAVGELMVAVFVGTEKVPGLQCQFHIRAFTGNHFFLKYLHSRRTNLNSQYTRRPCTSIWCERSEGRHLNFVAESNGRGQRVDPRLRS